MIASSLSTAVSRSRQKQRYGCALLASITEPTMERSTDATRYICG
ncbi:hypothetical protein AZ54_16900 [Xanthomonas oryzae pv. oryzae PXO86]|nr:hypothetical protein AZ54_16900 [Xanthomonas oryzae pv. oryzae PXO86]